MPWPFTRTKKAQSPAELVPGGLADVHAHLLPGVDDGPEEMAGALDLARGLAELGYTRLTATPHYDIDSDSPSPATLETLIAELEAGLGPEAPSISLGAEIPFDDRFLDADAVERLPTLGPAPTYLIELGFSPGALPPRMASTCVRLQARGLTLVLAHPERCPDLGRNPDAVAELRRAGVLMQIGLATMGGKHGERARRRAWRLVERGLADVVATDVHSADDLQAVGHALEELADLDRDALIRLGAVNPRHLLDGKPEEIASDD